MLPTNYRHRILLLIYPRPHQQTLRLLRCPDYYIGSLKLKKWVIELFFCSLDILMELSYSNLYTQYKRIRGINTQTNSLSYLPKSQLPNTLKKLEPPDVSVTPAPSVLDALYAVQTTPYANSFASRLAGSSFVISNNEVENGNCKYRRTYLHRDWEGQSPWMDLMDDIHEHHSLMQCVFILYQPLFAVRYRQLESEFDNIIIQPGTRTK